MVSREKILLVLVLFAVFFFTACAEKKNQSVVQFSSWGSQSEIEVLKPILKEFEVENPDIKIDFVHIPQNYFQKIHLLFASNMPPDVIFLNNLYLPIYANAGVLEPIDFDSMTNLKKSKFYEKSLDALSYKGKLYAIPRDVSNLVIYYNKDIFRKYEIPFPSKFWTFNDFLILAQKLTKDTDGDGKTDLWGISFEDDPPLFYLPYLMSEGGGILSNDASTIIIDSPESKKGLQFYSDLRKKYHVSPTKAESASATMAQMFLQGRLAMQLSGRWLVPKYLSDAKFEWNVVNFPAGDKGSIVPLDASGWAVTKDSTHKKAAIKLIEFLASKENSEKFTQSGLIVPARKDVAQGRFLEDNSLKLNNKVFLDVIKTSKPTPVSVNYNKILDTIQEKTNYLFN